MTRIPVESWDVTAMTGPLYLKYKVKSICAHPECSRYVDHVHHVVRRSFIIGDVSWVKYGEGSIVGNLVGLCYHHHQEVTINRALIIWEERLKQMTWCDVDNHDQPIALGPLNPQPPIQAKGVTCHTHENGEPVLIGPGSSHICPTCRQAVRAQKDKTKREAPKRRKTWSLTVPDDVEEDGGVVLDQLVEICAELFGRDITEKKLRYFVVAQALALVVQNAHLLSQEEKPGK